MKIKKPELIEQKRNEIIEIAKKMIIEEGLEALSIRKIATVMNQTPGIIYHYFKDKEEIINNIVQLGYQDILSVIKMGQSTSPTESIYYIFKGYIKAMLDNYYLFEIIMNSSSKEIKDNVNILNIGISKHRKSMQLLCSDIDRGNREGVFKVENIELRAQTLWCATYGLIQRIAIEKPINREEIIEEHLQMLLSSMRG